MKKTEIQRYHFLQSHTKFENKDSNSNKDSIQRSIFLWYWGRALNSPLKIKKISPCDIVKLRVVKISVAKIQIQFAPTSLNIF